MHSGDILKHLKDVISLSGLLRPEIRINLAPRISADLKEFISKVSIDKYPDFARVKARLLLAYGLE